MIEAAVKGTAATKHIEEQKGDAKDTWADTRKLVELLSWYTRTEIVEGMKSYV